MFQRVAIITVFLIASVAPDAQALVRINKGPAFLIKKENRRSQPGLLGAYAAFNTQHEVMNIALRREIYFSTRQLSASDFKLEPLPPKDHYLAFGYKDEQGIYQAWDFVGTRWGYCHGMTMVTRNFAYLAEYAPSKRAPYDFKTQPELWIRYYERLIDRVMRGKKAIIPEFKTLTELSSSPMAGYLQRHVADQWGLNTARIAAYQNVYKNKFTPLEDVKAMERFRQKLKSFLSHGFFPRVVIGPPRYKLKDPHVVMVTSLGEIPNASGCYPYTYFNVGMNSGGSETSNWLCPGDHLWIPNDERSYLLDFARELKR